MIFWYYLKYKILFYKIVNMVYLLVKTGGKESKYPKYVQKFEKNFSNFIGTKYGLTFCNGTSLVLA